ncbi:BspA family leucine-rich repeat surface protein [Mycoplasma feriruminatoris]|uniref:BspA family leucine-rich repeat surface protein n=1 Tax=Mycoplasma feriruminatoris TaxID=1179777 RepID=A0AAQ3DL90_9MOLU|nr:BspA family leucine-rich repeat surface protein [Mycoplasma feriruminatoris]WFQ94959.1 BspA family leucine-rich repeat surface protein [Mycoplasma feriruminatoris]
MKMLLKALSFILVSSSSLLVISCTNNKPSSSQNINSNTMNANTRNNNEKKEEIIIKKPLTAEQQKQINDIFTSQQDAFATFHTYQDVVDQLQVFLAKEKLDEVKLFNKEEKDKTLQLDDSGTKNSIKIRVFGNEFEFKPKTVKNTVETIYSDDKKEKVVQLGYSKKPEGKINYYVLNTLDQNTKEVPENLPLKVNSLSDAFKENKNEKIVNIDKWNTKNIVSFKNMFYSAKSFNQDISKWNTSNAENMSAMFFEAEKFNKPLDKWDVSKVKDMESIFDGATVFNQNLNNWTTSSLVELTYGFRGALKFNQPLDKWDVSNVKTMDGLFSEAYEFNQNITLWKTSNVESMNGMFSDAKAFNQNLSNWDVKKVGNYQNFANGLQSTMTKDKLPKFNNMNKGDEHIYGLKK